MWVPLVLYHLLLIWFTCYTLLVCDPNPCRNGGTCTLNDINYHCECARCYEGSCCENSVTSKFKSILFIIEAPIVINLYFGVAAL